MVGKRVEVIHKGFLTTARVHGAEGLVGFGVAEWNPEDPYDRAKGRLIAVGRAEKSLARQIAKQFEKEERGRAILGHTHAVSVGPRNTGAAAGGPDDLVPDALVDVAWRLLANVSEGDWDKQPPEWQQAALRFREQYHEDLVARGWAE